MNTLQLDDILYNDKYCGPVFHGTHAIDEIPKFQYGCYVINLAPSSHPGTHWVAVFHEKDQIEYFDSTGNHPSNTLICWWGHKRLFTTNPYTLQSPYTDVCGQYTVYFLVHRCRGIRMRTILNSFTSNKIHNDEMVRDFVNQKYANFKRYKPCVASKATHQSARCYHGGYARYMC